MSNSYFRFKEFTIQQDKCAMKVCTDSCLFGAWTAEYLQRNKHETQNILDIGAGTGLLSLMLAQKLLFATIDAVEIEPHCFEQAATNISQSPWNERIEVHQCDINDFTSRKKYNLIISNPPFYESDLLAKSKIKNMAHHDAGLTLRVLVGAVKKFLTEEGCFAILLPYHRSSEFEILAHNEGLFANKKTSLKQTAGHSFFRTMFVFSKEKKDVYEDEIAIKENGNVYSDRFISLLKDYYLYL